MQIVGAGCAVGIVLMDDVGWWIEVAVVNGPKFAVKLSGASQDNKVVVRDLDGTGVKQCGASGIAELPNGQ